MTWNVGERLVSDRFPDAGVRKVVVVRRTGYDWRYPDLPDVLMSEDSSEPMLVHWRRKPR